MGRPEYYPVLGRPSQGRGKGRESDPCTPGDLGGPKRFQGPRVAVASSGPTPKTSRPSARSGRGTGPQTESSQQTPTVPVWGATPFGRSPTVVASGALRGEGTEVRRQVYRHGPGLRQGRDPCEPGPQVSTRKWTDRGIWPSGVYFRRQSKQKGILRTPPVESVHQSHPPLRTGSHYTDSGAKREYILSRSCI